MYNNIFNLIKPYDTIIIGLSGGPDSVFLLHTLNNLKEEYNLTLIAAHLDHEWREESFKDVIFCQNLCKSLNIEFISQKASNIKITKKTKGSKEELGRLLRRAFFEQLASEHKANSIALAHHADDQQETFFIRLIRGATVSGLSSMRPLDGLYIRPLLEIYKQEILDYLDQNKIKYLIDPTNASDSFLRNRIRNYVIPALKKCDDRFDYNFLKTITHIQNTEEFLESITQKAFSEITFQDQDTTLWLDIKKLSEIDPFLHKRILLLWLCFYKVQFVPSDLFFDEILRFLFNTKSNKHTFGSWFIYKKSGLAKIESL